MITHVPTEQDRAASLSAMVDTLKREMGSAMTRQDELSHALTTQVGVPPSRLVSIALFFLSKC